MIYQIKISIKNIETPVWRKLQIDRQVTLDHLHLVIQTAMGWNDKLMHQFVKDDNYYLEMKDLSPVENELNEAGYRLCDILKNIGETMQYDYGFKESWEHQIELEKIDRQKKINHPFLIKGEKRVPPEGLKDASFYDKLFNAFTNNDKKTLSSFINIVGSNFDPYDFPFKKVSEKLKQL